MQFINPALLFGTLLFAVPLIIHLLNRQRYKRRRWAAMEYLLIAFKKQRRRLRVENLLLLLLRCLIPILLALAIARPVLREGGAIAGLGSTSAHNFIVLDASYSMGYQPEGGSSPYQLGRRMIDQLLQRLEDRSGATKVTLVIAGVRPSVPVQGDLDVNGARSWLAANPDPQDGAGDLGEALRQVADLVEEAADTDRRVYLFTDLQVRAFGPDPLAEDPDPARPAFPPAGPGPDSTGAPEAGSLESTRDTLEHLATMGDVFLLDVGPTADRGTGGPEDNLSITHLRTERVASVTRVPVPVVATVLNRSAAPRSVEVALEIDGSEPQRRVLDMQPGAEAEAEFEVTFRDTGTRTLRAFMPPDGLAADDARYLALEARERIRILLVDGNADAPDVPEDIREATLLRNLLDPTGGEGPPELTVFDPKIVSPVALLTGEEDLGAYDLLVLANVDVLNTRTINAIEDAVRAGMGLLVMLGDRTDLSQLNNLNRGNEGAMPMLLTRRAVLQTDGTQSYHANIARPEHPIFQDLLPEVFEAARVWGFVAADPESIAEDAQVLATLNDAEQSPLLVASRFGNGKTLFLTSAVSRRPDRWNDFYPPVVALPLFHPIAYWLSLPAADPFNAEVGSVLTCTLEYRPTNVAVTLPERAGQVREPVPDDRRPLAGGRFGLPPFRRTWYAGFYNFETTLETVTGNEEVELPFAVNVDPEEGDLRYFAHDAAVDRLGVKRVLRALPSEDGIIAEVGSSELGPPLLMLVLLVLLGEAALARFVTRRRS